MAEGRAQEKRRDEAALRRRLLRLGAGMLVLGVGVAAVLDPGTFRIFAGALSVQSQPAGAEVYLDGERLGVTPLTAKRLATGERTLRLDHPHRGQLVEKIMINRGETQRVERLLPEAFGSLELLSNPRGADVVLDGEPLETATPIELERLVAGVHTVRLSYHQHRDVEQELEVLPGETTSLTIELPFIAHGTLTVRTRPARAAVEIIGLDEPHRPGQELPVGEYTVEVSAPGHLSAQRRLRVGQGDNEYQVVLERPSVPLTVATRPASAEVTVEYELNGARQSRRYRDGLQVPMGRVTVLARVSGYRTRRTTVDVGAEGRSLTLSLEAFTATPGETFRDKLKDGSLGPEVIIVAPGRYRMGDLLGTGAADERPAHEVLLTEPFAVGIYEISVAEFSAFREVSGNPKIAEDRERHPVANVSPADVDAYLRWLSEQTGERYRLPSEAEWEYLARAGSEGAYPAGAEGLCQYANVADQSTRTRFSGWEVAECTDGFPYTAPVGSLEANAFGLHDTLGNVAEWVADCWSDSYENARSDGVPVSGPQSCYRVYRGGSWDSQPGSITYSYRLSSNRGNDDRGFRVVREL